MKQAILATLIYSDHFSYPLTFDELYYRLIFVRTTRKNLLRHLSFLTKQKIIILSHGFYHLPGKNKLVDHRLQNQQTSLPKQKLAHQYATTLSRVPGVVAIYLTGSLAVNNANPNDDIDFMIITKSGKLWLTRLMLTLYCQFLGIKKSSSSASSSHSKDKNRVCLNLYLTPSSLSIPPSRRSLYTAYELIQAKPIFDPNNTHSLLLSQNRWLYTYLPNFPFPPALPTPPKLIHHSLLEIIAFKLQYWYMRKKITREYVTLDQAFFHPKNPATKVLSKINICSIQSTPSNPSSKNFANKAKK